LDYKHDRSTLDFLCIIFKIAERCDDDDGGHDEGEQEDGADGDCGQWPHWFGRYQQGPLSDDVFKFPALTTGSKRKESKDPSSDVQSSEVNIMFVIL
jgi:hypothetical protein